MQKISLTLDVDKLRELVKNNVKTRTYTNKDGEEVTVNEIQVDVVPLKEPKPLKQGDGWNMVKTHFVAEPTSKEEREAGKKGIFVGDGIQFQNTDSQVNDAFDSFNQDTNDVPF